MPFSITHNTLTAKTDIKNKTTETTEKKPTPEKCLTELKQLEKCLDEKKECMDLLNVWIKCSEQPYQQKEEKEKESNIFSV